MIRSVRAQSTQLDRRTPRRRTGIGSNIRRRIPSSSRRQSRLQGSPCNT